MDLSQNDRRIDYIEFSSTDIQQTKNFYHSLFNWEFEDFGPDYTSFRDGRMSGGFAKADSVKQGGPLVVLYASDLESIKGAIVPAGGTIVLETVEFPGGRRFHFSDPSGNELAIWTDQ